MNVWFQNCTHEFLNLQLSLRRTLGSEKKIAIYKTASVYNGYDSRDAHQRPIFILNICNGLDYIKTPAESACIQFGSFVVILHTCTHTHSHYSKINTHTHALFGCPTQLCASFVFICGSLRVDARLLREHKYSNRCIASCVCDICLDCAST